MPFVDHLCFFFVVGVPLFAQPCAGSCHACFFKSPAGSVAHVVLHFFVLCCCMGSKPVAGSRVYLFHFWFCQKQPFWLMFVGHVLFCCCWIGSKQV